MSRRPFRPACPDLLEVRIAPSLATPVVSHVHVQRLTAPATHVAKKSTVTSVDWHKVGTQVTDFLGFTHHKKAPARPAKAHATAHTLTR